MQTFEIELERKKIQRSNAKAVTTCFVGDLSDSLLFLSLIKKIDMVEVLSYPIIPAPLSLSYPDDSMLSSLKSSLIKYLETFAISETPEVVHETIIDAMFFLRLM